jgi:hypothetical protein
MKKRKHVFISYKREQQEIASAVRLALKASGFKVWWEDAPEFMKLVRAIKSTSKHNTLVALRNF